MPEPHHDQRKLPPPAAQSPGRRRRRRSWWRPAPSPRRVRPGIGTRPSPAVGLRQGRRDRSWERPQRWRMWAEPGRDAPSALTDLAASGRGLAGARVQKLATERGERLPEHGNTAGRGAAASGEGGIAASGPDYRIAATPCAATPCPRAVTALRSLQPHCTAADHTTSARSPCRDSWRPQPPAAPWPAARRRRGALLGVAP